MKPRNLPDDHARFSAHVRHYHRSGAQSHKSWEEWVEGKPATTGGKRKMAVIVGVIVAVLALAGIITGLVIELR